MILERKEVMMLGFYQHHIAKMFKVKEKLTEKIVKNKRIYFLLRCIKRFNDDEFINDVLSIYNNPNVVCLRNRSGMENQDVILYNMNKSFGSGSGFFATFNHILEHLWCADFWGLKPIISIGEGWPYYEIGGVDNVYNAWEYYFQQYEGRKTEEIENSSFIVDYFCGEMGEVFPKLKHEAYGFTEEYLTEMGRIMRKYIRLNETTYKYITSEINSTLKNKKTLGVQIRMGGMLYAPSNHPVVPTLDEYVKEIKQGFFKGSFEQIYLATDDVRAVKRMQDEFGDRVVYYKDVIRVEGMLSTYDVPSQRKNHKYLCGLEVLRDMYTLTFCDGLVAGLSQVSIASQIAKKVLKKNGNI